MEKEEKFDQFVIDHKFYTTLGNYAFSLWNHHKYSLGIIFHVIR